MARRNVAMLCTTLVLILGPGPVSGVAGGAGFGYVCSWAAFDAGNHGVGYNPDGYVGGVFDGRYVYFAPYHNSTGKHGEVLRYDTSGDFADTSAWTTFDAGSHGVGNDPDGYWGAVFDGRYVYFVPCNNGSSYHGEVLRYDTLGDFADVFSWAAFDAGDHGVGNDPDGYIGGTFDGRYVYFAPYHNGTSNHGEVLRYDTAGSFDDVSSWSTFDAGAHGVGEKYGYAGAVFDGRYVYFVANCTSDTSHHGEVRRYDTTGDFADPSSWAAFDAGDHGVGNDPDGYVGGVFDGRYVYFVPNYNEPTNHGEVLRFDTTGDFLSAASWAAFDPGANGVGNDPDGYIGGVFDGRYVYFVPGSNGSHLHSEVLRYDTDGDFSNVSAWDTFDPGTYGVTNGYGGYAGGIFDGRHVYFAPSSWGYPNGEVLRYDTFGCCGDLNCDGAVNAFDIDPFVLALTDPAAYGAAWPACNVMLADCNGDGVVDAFDIDPFVELLTGP